MPRRPLVRPGFRFVPGVDRLEDRLTPAARVQFLSAAPFPGGAFLDVYVNDALLRDSLPYGNATRYQTVPVGVPVTIDITRGDASNNANPIVSVTQTFADNTDTFIGIVGNPLAPPGSDAALSLKVFTPARVAAADPNGADVLVFNASPDSPSIDLAQRDQIPFASDLVYPNFNSNGYVSLPADRLTVDFFPGGRTAPTKSYTYDLSSSAGTGNVLAAIGFINPTVIPSNNIFTLVNVAADGTVLALEPTTLPARLQLFNNDPFPAFRSVDVYVNGVKVANDLAYQAATPYLTVPPNQDLTVDFSPGDAADNVLPLFSSTVRVGSGTTVFAQLAGNPQAGAGTQVLTLSNASGRLAADDNETAAVRFAQGAGDSPPADFLLRNLGTAGNDVPANGIDPVGYFALPAAPTEFDVRASDGITRLGSFAADLTPLAGQAAVVATSGFLSPAAGDPNFSLVLVPAAGGPGVVLTPTAPFAPPTTFAAGGTFGGRPRVQVFGNTGNAVGPPLDADGTTAPRVALADVNGDGTADVIIGTGPGVVSGVTVRDGRNPGQILFQTQPFEGGFTGGVFVAGGDLNADGLEDVVISPDQGGGPRIDIFAGGAFGKVASYFAFRDDLNFRGGVRPTIGDVNADGRPDLTISAGFGGGPRVAVFDGRTALTPTPTRLVPDFFAFETSLRNGAFVAVGDVNADGFGDIIAGAGPGGGPRVIALSGQTLLVTGGAIRTLLANFFAGDAGQRGGVSVTVADVDGDFQADLVTGQTGGGPQVRAFPGRTLAPGEFPPPPSSEATPFDATSGVFVG